MAAWALLALLLALDLVLIFSHLQLVEHRQVFVHPWSVEADGGYPERFQYLKWLGACLLLLALAARRRAAIYAGWAAIFLYFLLDDGNSIHERFGGWLAAELHLDRIQQIYVARFPDLFLRPRDFGELAAALITAAAVAIILIVCWPARDAVRERAVTKWLIAWLGLFAFFAVGVDMVHVMALDPVTVFTPAAYVLGLVEDAGEMICASLLVGGLALELTRGSAAL